MTGLVKSIKAFENFHNYVKMSRKIANYIRGGKILWH